MNDRLGDSEIAFYRENGYLMPEFRIPQDLLQCLTTAVEALIERFDDVQPEDLANPHMLPDTDDEGINPFMQAARHPRILDRVEQLIGPDIVLWITRILCKPAAVGREVPWHQDGEYWPIRPLNTCSVWLAIDPATPDNGCMRFIPGSHRQQALYRHHVIERDGIVLNREVDDDQFDRDAAVDVKLQPGQISLHDVRMIHGSAANTSSHRRAALIMRYMSAESHYDRTLVNPGNSAFDITHQPLWLMRGTDRSGKNDFQHGHAQWRERYARGLELS